MLEPEKLREYLSRGALVVVQITPFRSDEELDLEGLKLNTEFLVERRKLGPMVLVPTGSTGEFYALNDEERKKAISTVVDVAGGKIPVIAGTMRAGARWTAELSRYAEDIGADGVMVVLPYYHIPSEEGLLEHYKMIAGSIDIGLLLYNNPDVSKIYVNPRLMKRLAAEIPNLVGVKENTPYVATFYEQVKAVGDKIPIIQGRGEWWYISTVILGATGYVSGYANFMPQLSFEILKAGTSKDFSKLSGLLEEISIIEEFISEMNIKYGPSTSILPLPYIQNYMVYAVIKAAMDIIGLKGGRVRLPLIDLRIEDKKRLERILLEDLCLEKIG